MKGLSLAPDLSLVSLLILLTLLPVACDKENDGVLDPGPSSTTSAIISRQGGAMKVASGGATLTATFPPDAVLEDTRFTLRGVEPPDGTMARFEVTPPGLMLHAPVTVAVKLSEHTVAPEELRIRVGAPGQHTTLTTVLDPRERTLTAESQFWGAPLGSDLEAVSAASLAPGGASLIDVGRINCQMELAALRHRVLMAESWFTSDGQRGSFYDIPALRRQYESFKATCVDSLQFMDPDQWEEFARQEIYSRACTIWEHASVGAAIAPPSQNWDQLGPLLTSVLGGWGVMEMTGGADCVDLETVGSAANALIHDLVSEHIDFLAAEASQPASSTRWTELLEGLRYAAVELKAVVNVLGLEDLDTRLGPDVACPLAQNLRERAFYTAIADGNPFYIADLAWGVIGRHCRPLICRPCPPARTGPCAAVDDYNEYGFDICLSVEQLQRDIQYVGTSVAVEVYEDANRIHSVQMGRGATPGAEIESTAVTAKIDGGSIRISGIVYALRCYNPNGDHFDSADELVFLATNGTNRVELGRRGAQNGAYLGAPFEVSVSWALERLGLPEEAGQTFSISVERQGAHCNQSNSAATYFDEDPVNDGPSSFLLLQVDVTTEGDCSGMMAGQPGFQTEFYLDATKSGAYPNPKMEIPVPTAGRYRCTILSGAWCYASSRTGNCNVGWVTAYRIGLIDDTVINGGDWPLAPTPEEAFARSGAKVIEFDVPVAQTLQFYVGDNKIIDNLGGVFLRLENVCQ